MKPLITNKTHMEAFDIFNREYETKALSVCPELKNITIDAVCNYDSAHLAELNLSSNDAFAYYFYYQTSPKNAEIVVNKDVIKRQNITVDDTLAAIAHEIGHIISIEKHGDCFTELPAEVLGDEYVCRIGLKEQLIILLKKMIGCGEYFDFQVNWLEKRIYLLERFPMTNDISTMAKLAIAIEMNKNETGGCVMKLSQDDRQRDHRRSHTAGEGRRERDATREWQQHAAVYHRWQRERHPAENSGRF